MQNTLFEEIGFDPSQFAYEVLSQAQAYVRATAEFDQPPFEPPHVMIPNPGNSAEWAVHDEGKQGYEARQALRAAVLPEPSDKARYVLLLPQGSPFGRGIYVVLKAEQEEAMFDLTSFWHHEAFVAQCAEITGFQVRLEASARSFLLEAHRSRLVREAVALRELGLSAEEIAGLLLAKDLIPPYPQKAKVR